MTKATPLCAHCGEKPARRYDNAGTRMSPYCSPECGNAAKRAKMLERVGRTPGWGTDKQARSATDLCAFCGKNPVRRYSDGKLSPYCSLECGNKSRAAKAGRGGRERWLQKKYAVPSVAEEKPAATSPTRPLAMFSIPGVGEFDWREIIMNPFG